jgi:methyl-accepting chemotaxis protein
MPTKFKDLSVSTKIIGTFSIVLVATIALGLFSVQRLAQVNDRAQEVSDSWLPGMRDMGQLAYAAARLRSWQGATLMMTTPEQKALSDKNLATLQAKVSDIVKKFADTADTEKKKEIAARISAAWAEYQPMQDHELELNRTSGQDDAFAYYMGPMMKSFTELKDSIEASVAFHTDGGTAAGAAGEATFESARVLILSAIGLAALLCLFAGYTLIGAISKPLGRMTGAMGELAAGRLDTHVPHADQKDEVGKLAEAMMSFKNQLAAAERSKAEQTETIVSSIGTGLDHLAKGDLTHRVSAALTGPFGKLKDDFNQAMARLQDTLKNVLSSTNQIETGAGEISQAADDLSRRTEQQAASLEETAAALEEITSTVKKTASNSKEASSSVGAAKTAAQDGGRVVETAIKAMDSIAQSSKQITDIIGVIDEIAFQTNLLALNAGVEAARAGDAGKGFAVVASEVRALAQRSSEAAKEIKTLIHASGDHVASGVKLVGESGTALKLIVDQVEQINSLVVEMAQAAEQQSTGIEQVNAAVGQMDQVTQQNAAMVEQSTAASRNLATETKALSEIVGFFNVGSEKRPARTETAPRTVAASPKPAAKPLKAQAAVVGRRTAVAVARKPEVESEDWTEF